MEPVGRTALFAVRPAVWVLALCLWFAASTRAENRPTLSAMPRVDAHSHIDNDFTVMDEYMALRLNLRQELNVDLALWISLGRRGQALPDLEKLDARYKGRVLFAIHDYNVSDGLDFSPQELVRWQKQGVVGFKFYPGWEKGVQIDHPANDSVFDKMEQIGMVGAGVHVTDPNGPWGRRTEWFPEPVEFWRQQHAWETVLERHPNLVVVNSHMLWLCHSDEQLDYLRYMLTTHPNLNIDLATALEFAYPVTRDNLRDFMIAFADRILFGTDMGTKWFAPDLGGAADQYKTRTANYARYFQILETDGTFPSGLKGEHRIRGLALPQEVLAKIYYRNAARIYPRVGEALKRLGYQVD